MARILFIDRRKEFDGETFAANLNGGVVGMTCSLALTLARRGHEVTVATAIEQDRIIDGVRWIGHGRSGSLGGLDLAVANNNTQRLVGLTARRMACWRHNPIDITNFYKHGEIGPILRLRPEVVLLSPSELRRVPRFLPYRRRHVIGHGLAPWFLRRRADGPAPPPAPVAIYASAPSRGLDWVATVWRERIAPAVPGARLQVYAPRSPVAADAYRGVEIMGTVSGPEMAERMARARVLLCPGHRQETFCSVAAEATTCGVPTVTRGVGALKDRVTDGMNGYVRRRPQAFAEAAVRLLTDDADWAARRLACLTHADVSTWDARAAEWERAFGLG